MKMTPAQLKQRVEQGDDHFFFTRDTMRFFGDTMSNYGVRAQPAYIRTSSGEHVECWELYRKRPVKHGLRDSAYFCIKTFRRITPTSSTTL